MSKSRTTSACIAITAALAGGQMAVAGPVFAAVSWAGDFAHIDAGSGQVSVIAQDLPLQLQGAALSPDGTLYAGPGEEGYIFTIDPATGAAERFIAISSDIRGMTFSPEGVLYVIARDEELESTVLRTIDLTNGIHTNIGSLPDVGVRAQGLAFSPDRQLYMVRAFSEFYDVYTIDLDDFETQLIGRQVGDLNQGLAFAPDGSMYALGQHEFAQLDPDDASIIGDPISFSGQYRGLAYIPEPTTLLFVALGALAVLRTRHAIR